MLSLLLILFFSQYLEALDILPKPYMTIKGSEVYSISQNVHITHRYSKCNILNDAIKRTDKCLFNTVYMDYEGPVLKVITEVEILIKAGCVEDSNLLMWPMESMNETYRVSVDKRGITIISFEIWGALRALETLCQLVYRNNAGTLCMDETTIFDTPRFSYRGYMLDTSRHFIPVEKILTSLEAMAMSKLNVFHWHIVDDNSFPYQSRTFLNLSKMGSFHQNTNEYTQRDIVRILDYARRRGIRVIPEFDSPGHSLSWGKSQPKLLTPCYSNSKPNGNYGPINPTLESTYSFLRLLFQELINVFPDNYIHLGGDEVDFGCWRSNPDVVNFTKKHGFPNDFAKLQGFYMVKLINMIKSLRTKKSKIQTMVWQEVFDNKNQVDPNSTIIHIWKGDKNWQPEMIAVTNKKYKAVLSACWYLDITHYGEDYQMYYNCDPQNYNGINKEYVIGGESCMWTEFVDETNVITRSWPRASVAAERLWSPQSTTDINDFGNRLRLFRCRLLINGIGAETATGAGTYCNRPGKF